MSYSFISVDGVEVILIPVEGRVDFARLQAIFEEALQEPRFAAGMPAVWDYRQGDLSGFDLPEMQKLADYVKRLDGRGGARVAAVVGHGRERPIMELWSEFMSLAVRQSRKVCLSLDEALQWAAAGEDA